MARGWPYTKLSISSVLLLYFFLACALCYCSVRFVVFVLFLSCFVLMLSLELCICSSDLFPVQQSTYRIGKHIIYYWVWLKARSVNVKNTTTHPSYLLLMLSQM